jgi:hypothetical protein
MDPFPYTIEALWDRLLSRQPETICAAYSTLSTEERQAVYQHLVRMSSEPGWHAEQRASAQVALAALQDLRAE